MDGIAASTGEALARRTEEARQRLEEALAALAAAMPEFGVQPGHPEAVFIGAMMGAQRTFGDIAIALGDDLRGVVQQARELNESEITRLREAAALADLTIRQAKAAATVAEGEHRRALGQVVKSMAPQITEILRDTVVLKEWRHNKRLNLLFRAKVVGLAALLVAGGYALRTWETWDAAAALSRCVAHADQNTAGRWYCPVDALSVTAAPAPR
jgi:hypothetical protein